MVANGSLPIGSWVRFTIINGFASVVCYLAAAFIPLPEILSLLLAFLFGPFFMLSTLGLFFIIKSWKASLALYSGTLFNLVATAFVTLMLVVQQSVFAFHDQFKSDPGKAVSDEQLKWIFKELNSVQLGMDVAWDIFISAGTFLLALTMLRHPVFGKIFSVTGMLVSLALFSFNLYSFPQPPSEAGSIDFGPFVSLWYLALTIFMLIKRSKLIGLAVRDSHGVHLPPRWVSRTALVHVDSSD